MPQMAPMSWTILFLIFSASLMSIAMMNYYLYIPQMPKTYSSKSQTETFDWKW